MNVPMKLMKNLKTLCFVLSTLLVLPIQGQDTIRLSLIPNLIGDSLKLQLVADNFIAVDNFELSFNYSNTDLLYTHSILNSSLLQQGNVTDLGFIYFNWHNPNAVPLTLPNQTVLGEFNFFVIQRNVQTCFDFNVNGRPIRFFDVLSTPISATGTGVCSHLFGGLVTGQLRIDVNNDCITDSTEPALSGKVVKFKTAGNEYLAITREDGRFERYLPFDNYSVFVGETDLFKACANNSSLTLHSQNFNTYFSSSINAKVLCPQLTVDFNAALINWCSSEYVSLKYFNKGSKSAEGAYIELYLDPNLSILQSSVPFTNAGSNIFRFELGTVELQTGNQIQLLIQSSCIASMQGRTVQCTAKIFPQITCIASPLFSGADLDITGTCVNNENVFEIKNVGTDDMKSEIVFNTVEDDIMPTFAGKLKLNKGATEIIKYPANGKTRIIIADTISNHPFQVRASAGVEGCGNGPISKGFLNNFAQGDQSPYFSKYSTELLSGNNQELIITSIPEGASSQKYINKDDRIYYTIRFRNKLNSAVHRLVLRNDIPSSLDLNTLELVRKDLHFEWNIVNNRTLEVVFNDINLPTDIDDEKGSQIWFSYSIKPISDLGFNTRIENRVSAIIDSKKLAQSNIIWHTVGSFIFTIVEDQINEDCHLNVYPNPFNDNIQFDFDQASAYRLLIYNSFGQEIENKYFTETKFNYNETAEWQVGNYYYIVFNQGKKIASGKIFKSTLK